MTTATPDSPARTGHPVRAVLRRWPAVFGAAFAAFVSYGLASGAELAPILTASGLVYLGAAALQKRGAAWPVFAVTFVVIGAADFTPWPDAPTWVLIALAVPFTVYGLLRGAARPAEGLPLQAIGMAVFGGAAAVVMLVGGDFGAYLVAAGLLGHAAWDVHHHRTGRVVVRSMAEFCFVLDTLIAVAMVVVALNG
ncbi:hypothetical protein [Glycomyces harbinensis]|uniref:Uncharacterized protein n=1 Tax=Glycomyces harbinensis TaxID=58114 RepID=A0A1G6R927_9ACTN|nr:hypothetical protein [Glycomyces harbinensis]SDD01048.1 hypothetical protein SAMN05216270_101367 [Glycomyces harbinensis]